jgi:hypothetical protein
MDRLRTPCDIPPGECPTYLGQKWNYCPDCGRADLNRLRGIGIKGWTGRSSTNPNIERFWETGDPEGLRRGDPGHVA